MATSTEVVVVGAGPAGSAAGAWAAQAGYDVTVIDAATFPRDKPCGDLLSPRAVAELRRLGMSSWLTTRACHRGLVMSGFGAQRALPWPTCSLPSTSTAVPRRELDDQIRRVAASRGAKMILGTKAVSVRHNSTGAVEALILNNGDEIPCRWLIVADGARSTLGRRLGRVWCRDSVYGVAIRCYASSPRHSEDWVSGDLFTSRHGRPVPGYGWVFPLGNGEVNIGVGTMSTPKRHADMALRPLLDDYVALCRQKWGFSSDVRAPLSAALPMGGAVTGVAGPNWMLVGDAAGLINPLNGEGIDYALESGRLAAELLDADDVQHWPNVLRHHYGRSHSAARRLARLLTHPTFLTTLGPLGMRSSILMAVGLRIMGNLITEDDADWISRTWRTAGAMSARTERRSPFT
ncbi:geranylgeranyl reductase family protein [Mycobacterium sp. 852002-40037_SCH5390672]|uniref:geranylgeranyl reductase family protein n=1 Tax=Mycobacterium sp. 852002-40037_SCH5390672 TaxID=1834089 RepID=UPI00080503E5|nr:geranylgeranyl reductase family protein [Mycobacterium sp. 852002-40037_SCH5390672]OBB96770.1 FAD-linked oxidoreductase [Mycobacterium sp. 852002-40037_SCH5390672]